MEGVALDTLDDMIDLFSGIPLGEVTTSMTINAPAAILLAFYVAAAEEQGVPPERLGGTIQTDILKEYIAQKEWCFPIEPAMRPRHRHGRVVHGAHAALAPDLDLRLPHPRGRLDRAAGARLHAQGRLHLRRAGARARPRRRRLRAPALVLLQRPHRLLRGDREVPRSAPDLGARDARHLRRHRPRLLADALPHADRGRQPHRPATAQQHRADRRSRRSPGFWAAPRACTRTPTTRRSPCRPRRRSGWLCAPSR